MDGFLGTEAGLCATVAKQFLEGALVLNDAPPHQRRLLFRPTLALAGHGLEQMLKACIFLNEGKPQTSGHRGHEITSMWNDNLCNPVRSHVFSNAGIAVLEDRDQERYSEFPSDENIIPQITDLVLELCKLHGQKGYPLRYATSEETRAPRTPFLVKSLWRTADDFVKRPNEFKLQPSML